MVCRWVRVGSETLASIRALRNDGSGLSPRARRSREERTARGATSGRLEAVPPGYGGGQWLRTASRAIAEAGWLG